MTTKYDDILLRVGNDATLMFLASDKVTKYLPKNSFQINFIVYSEKLTISAYLNYSILSEGFMSAEIFADPFIWISDLAYYTGSSLSKQSHELPRDLRIYIKVNGSYVIKDRDYYQVSCSVDKLIEITRKINEDVLIGDDASKLVLLTVDIED